MQELAYTFPIISNHFNSIEHSAVIEEYKKDINKMSEEELERKKEEIKEYNKVLNTLVEEKEDPFSENNKDQAKYQNMQPLLMLARLWAI